MKKNTTKAYLNGARLNYIHPPPLPSPLWFPAVFLSQNFRYFPAFYVVILVKYDVLFVLGKCFMNPEQVILIFTKVWPHNFYVSW